MVSGRIEKMSKSKKNVVDPQQIIQSFGADTARFFMLSDSPPNRDMEWSDSGIEGSWRFLNKLWNFVFNLDIENIDDNLPTNLSKSHQELLATLNTTIEEVTKSIDDFHFNIAVASIRSLFNAISSYKILNNDDKSVILHSVKKLLILINPMVPHIAEALWEMTRFTPRPYLSEARENTRLNNAKKRPKTRFIKRVNASGLAS